MENNRLKAIANKYLVLILLLLIVSNIYFYTRYRETSKNANYAQNFSSAISIAANSNDSGFLYSHFPSNDLENLEKKFKEIKPKIGRQYGLKQYITLEYENGNTLVIKTTENDRGKHLIEDMFILDKNQH